MARQKPTTHLIIRLMEAEALSPNYTINGCGVIHGKWTDELNRGPILDFRPRIGLRLKMVLFSTYIVMRLMTDGEPGKVQEVNRQHS